MKAKAEHTKGPDAPAKHTPGPWEVGPNRNGPEQEKAFDVLAPDPDEFAESGGKMIVADCLTEGDAFLIAACPDLLAAAESLLNCHTGAPWQTREIRDKAFRTMASAIRKARGKSHA